MRRGHIVLQIVKFGTGGTRMISNMPRLLQYKEISTPLPDTLYIGGIGGRVKSKASADDFEHRKFTSVLQEAKTISFVVYLAA
jgi:hypothetical protein